MPDRRQLGKVVHELPTVAMALLLGLIANRHTLRDVEALTHALGGSWRTLVPQTISDTTLDTVLRQLPWQHLQDASVALVRELSRSKLLGPIPGLPIRLVVVDGKNLATLDHDAEGTAQARSTDNNKWQSTSAKKDAAYWLAPALRAVLASTEARACLLQMPLGPKTNESGSLKDFLALLQQHYGRSDLLDVLSLDAGLTSLSNADAITAAKLRYVLGLKDNQPELLREAKLLLQAKANDVKAEDETPWERRGCQYIKRQLWRTDELEGFENSGGAWPHLQQVWLVRQTTRNQDGSTTHEDRYFLSSLPWQELGGWQILACVRLHWAIEDDVFNALDVQWKEDAGTW